VSISRLGLRLAVRPQASAERKMRDELLSSINFTSSQDERDFYARFVGLKLKGLEVGGPLRTEVVNRLQELVWVMKMDRMYCWPSCGDRP
jgi:hypothetical protein